MIDQLSAGRRTGGGNVAPNTQTFVTECVDIRDGTCRVVHMSNTATNATCQHCNDEVIFAMGTRGFREFVHIATGDADCSTDEAK